MKIKIHGLVRITILAILLLLAACGQKDILSKMRKQVPIFDGAQVLESYIPEKNVGVIKMEIDVSKASQREILDFYKNTMTSKGWELKKLKDYGKNGSIMELVKKDTATLSVMTIMKKTQETGKIPVTLNLTKN